MAIVVTLPDDPIPSLAEVKAHLKATDYNDDDADITSKIWGAINEFDDPNLGFLGRTLIARQIEMSFDEFDDCIYLNDFPILSGASYPFTIVYDDEDGIEQTLVNTVYRVLDPQTYKARVVLRSGESWPSIYDQEQAVRIRFWAGYDEDDVRLNNFKSAVKLHVEMTYDGDPDKKMNYYETIYRLLNGYKVLRV